ncbi:MAG: nucleoside triphosphate pyrophosphohydrolase [Hyphomicrobiaceae bacterium]
MSAENGGRKTLDDLVAIMAALRTPVTGCPWDLEQDFSTIAPYTIEEAYEVADAIERGDRSDLCEELGDLLLQVVYHARMAEEEGAFALADVVDGIARKMVRRHPHVFGDEAARSAGAAKGFWEDIKAKEKAARAARTASTTADAGTSPAASLLAEVPTGLPALTRAVKLQSKAARVGFDWPSLGPVFDKMREELAELEAALGGSPSAAHAGIDWKTASPEHREIEAELGDLFFVMANVARHLAIDPEAALRSANAKFARRFAHIERRLAADGRSPAQSDLAEMDRLWDEAKNLERKPETKDEA